MIQMTSDSFRLNFWDSRNEELKRNAYRSLASGQR